MNAAWAKEWTAHFAHLDKPMDMYAADAQFEDVSIAHKESGKVEIKTFFAAGNPAYEENTGLRSCLGLRSKNASWRAFTRGDPSLFQAM
jgi:hypothetical protein